MIVVVKESLSANGCKEVKKSIPTVLFRDQEKW